MKALIFNNKVVDVQENSFEVHESMFWVDCDSNVETGYTYENNQFIAPGKAVIDYSIERRMNYPQLADFADAYYWAQQGDNTKMDEYLQKIKDVKEKYPKVTDAN
jgi:hypothetical protein